MYARFPVPVRGKRHRDGHVAHISSSGIVSLREFLRRTSAQNHVGRTERLKLVNEVPKDQVAIARKCAHGKKLKCGVSAMNHVQLSA